MVGANFTPFDFMSLIASIVLFYWEPFEDRKWKKRTDLHDGVLTTFSSIWFSVKTCCVVALFTFSYYSIDTTHVAFQTVMALIITNALLSKFWPLLFITHHRRAGSVGAALGLTVLLFGTALAAIIMMVIHRANAGPLYPVPLAMYCVYTFALLFGMWFNAHHAGLVRFNVSVPCLSFGTKEKSHKERYSREDVEMPVVTNVRKSDYPTYADATYTETKMPTISRQIVHQPSRMV